MKRTALFRGRTKVAQTPKQKRSQQLARKGQALQVKREKLQAQLRDVTGKLEDLDKQLNVILGDVAACL